MPTLGSAYLPVLAAADVVVGNSSSGVVEAASFGVPAVDVGDRQRGRPTGANVIHCAEDSESVAAGIARALTPEFRAGARGAVNIYGDGNSAPRVVELILQTVGAPLSRKPFIDGGR